jgi:hypothetical protein
MTTGNHRAPGKSAGSLPHGQPEHQAHRDALFDARTLKAPDRAPAVDEQFFPVWVSWMSSGHLTFEAEREWVRRGLQTLKRGMG